MSRYTLLIMNGAILTGCAVFIYPVRTFVITALLLFLPLLDRAWRLPDFSLPKKQLYFVLSGLGLYGFMSALHAETTHTALSILFLVALPEEWFFRAYFMMRAEKFLAEKNIQIIRADWMSNIASSLFFALIHIPTQGGFGLSVFFPSLVFGWVFQKYKNLALVIILHAISNLIFILFIHDFLI